MTYTILSGMLNPTIPFEQADEILPKINAFNQRYVCKQELVYLVQ